MRGRGEGGATEHFTSAQTSEGGRKLESEWGGRWLELVLLEPGCSPSSRALLALVGSSARHPDRALCSPDPVSCRCAPSCPSLPLLCDGEDGRATHPRVEGDTVATEAVRGSKDREDVQGRSALSGSLRADSVCPSPSKLSQTHPALSSGCRGAQSNGLLSPTSPSFS